MISRKSQVEIQLNCLLIPPVAEGEKEGFGVKKSQGFKPTISNKTRGIPHRAHTVLRAKKQNPSELCGN